MRKREFFGIILSFFITACLQAQENSLSIKVTKIVRKFAPKLQSQNINKIFILDFCEETTQRIYSEMNNELRRLFVNELTSINISIVEKITQADGILSGAFIQIGDNLRISSKVEDINGNFQNFRGQSYKLKNSGRQRYSSYLPTALFASLSFVVNNKYTTNRLLNIL